MRSSQSEVCLKGACFRQMISFSSFIWQIQWGKDRKAGAEREEDVAKGRRSDLNPGQALSAYKAAPYIAYFKSQQTP